MDQDQEPQHRWNSADHYLVGGCLLAVLALIFLFLLTYAALDATTH